ncbi:hypothetical protein [Entomomonas asaccharolytica]|uniref:Uncharacterized protein n=1 Tax=Entomomonas asaccharolytica TaxID=2785331 RepID=A0A974NHF5_9GAMM|nr:hypothetical protein [Entomomonas asaccharolytica]QQP86910.1 hypothetical protein JHT90_06610 [Entomomonas asaccharolytica]
MFSQPQIEAIRKGIEESKSLIQKMEDALDLSVKYPESVTLQSGIGSYGYFLTNAAMDITQASKIEVA